MSSAVYDYLNDFRHIFNHSMKLEDSSITKFSVAKEFPENKIRINSIDFSQDGKTLIASSDDDKINVYDCERGIDKREIVSKKYGCDLIRFTHASNTAIYTSTKENDTIRYLSLHDNKYLKYFIGHEKRVVTLCMSPADDTFLSGSLDQTVRLWDIRIDKPIAKLSVPGYPIANYDPEGLIFAIGIDSETIKFFDNRNYDKGPFNTIKYPKPDHLQWKTLKFSPNGKQILITTDREELYILDAFSGSFMHKLKVGPDVSEPIEHPLEASYTPDSQYIISGSTEGRLHIWNANEAKKVAVLDHPKGSIGPVQCVKFNPKYMFIASGSSRMSLWIPTCEEDDL